MVLAMPDRGWRGESLQGGETKLLVAVEFWQRFDNNHINFVLKDLSAWCARTCVNTRHILVHSERRPRTVSILRMGRLSPRVSQLMELGFMYSQASSRAFGFMRQTPREIFS